MSHFIQPSAMVNMLEHSGQAGAWPKSAIEVLEEYATELLVLTS
jgi:hypothetical protein